MQSLTTYIQRPELLNAETVQELQQLVERYPSFQTARLLYLLGLFSLQDERFGAELRKAAVCLPDRRKLFDLFDSEHFSSTPKPTPEPSSEKTTDATATSQPVDRTQSLIESFLDQQPDQQPRHAHAADATVDYMSYLLQLEDAHQVQNADNESDPDEEVEEALDEKGSTEPTTPRNDPSDTYFTETLARIYIKQGKYAKAIEIIRRISLINPKKNRYFADQIRFLEKLIVNERANNEDK